MRKLTEGTFSDKYKFKRLLQTHADVAKRYKSRDVAINSIPAIKDIAIYEGIEAHEFVPGERLTAESMQCTLISQGDAAWPRRITFPEQVRQIYENGTPLWSINLTVNSSVDFATRENVKSYQVRIRKFLAPVIATQKKHAGWRPIFEPIPPAMLRNIENNDKVFYYLTDAMVPPEDQDPWDVWSAGLIPNLLAEFNACFYDREVAHLYAESLRAEIHRIDNMHFRN